MPSYKIELNNKPNKDSKEHKLLLRITVDRKHSRIALDYSVLPSQFIPNPKQQIPNKSQITNSNDQNGLVQTF